MSDRKNPLTTIQRKERVYYLTDDALLLLERETRGQLIAWVFAGAGWVIALALLSMIWLHMI